MRILDLLEMLKTTITLLAVVFICIDGLDECRWENLRVLLETLQKIVQVSPATRVFLSGRPHVMDEISRHFAERIMTSVTPKCRDIERYLAMRLDTDAMPWAMDSALKAEIMKEIPVKIFKMCVEITSLRNHPSLDIC